MHWTENGQNLVDCLVKCIHCLLVLQLGHHRSPLGHENLIVLAMHTRVLQSRQEVKDVLWAEWKIGVDILISFVDPVDWKAHVYLDSSKDANVSQHRNLVLLSLVS